ncbi:MULTISPECIES: sigma-70 family RNA polymerase sigma factor [unclassified Romboutsia]|uniref:sigma-70 family RNA polymerase sigma factor n=1 Tax=unclassified Romboutsia TaxID=2626894 RepID=UPI00082315B6|nr:MULTISPECIES: sigma-70 family RNA polymerase sigma factor [unclassified Romboutsia]SCH45517.1 RNA polymerase sigma factor sigV [uncultured Clostridium sp.]
MDEKLVKKAIKGNFNAYSILVHNLKNEGYKIAYTILKNEHDSIDAYLQAVEKGLKNITSLKEAKYFKTWFLKIVINEAKNIINKNNKVIYLEELEERKDVKHEDKESKLDLEVCLQKVEPQIREMIRLKYYMGYKLEEISSILDVPIGTVKGKMYTALKDMKKQLEVK